MPEGEKCTDAVKALGFCATTTPGGSNGLKPHIGPCFTDRDVVLLADNDSSGEIYIEKIIEIINPFAKSIKVLRFHDLNIKEDVYDWKEKGGTKEQLLDLINSTPIKCFKKPVANDNSESTVEKLSPAAQIVEECKSFIFFHDQNQEPYSIIEINERNETFAVHSAEFNSFLSRMIYKKHNKVPSPTTLSSAISVLTAMALHDNPEKAVFLRVAGIDEKIYIDIANTERQVCEITQDGFNLIQSPPLAFIRKKSMTQLPLPDLEGNIAELREFLNLENDSDFSLIIGWLLCAMNPKGPYIILILQGPQGSAKSTTARRLRELTDPCSLPLTSFPSSEDNLAIAAKNSRILSFDNLSGIKTSMSDALCRISTGGGFRKRTLYTNDEETLFDIQRPISINGIDDLTSRADLCDRSIVINLPVIPSNKRKTEKGMNENFNHLRSRIFGALVNAIASGLKHYGQIELKDAPRMKDAVTWITACEKSFSDDWISFQEAYTANRKEVNQNTLEANPVGEGLIKLLQDSNFEGTATQLLKSVTQHSHTPLASSRYFPKTPIAMSNALERLRPNLLDLGYEIKRGRVSGGKKRFISIKQIIKEPSQPSLLSQHSLFHDNSDDNDSHF